MYMDDIKLFGKNEIELEILIEAVRTYIQDIGMEFGIEKWAMLIMRSGKRQMMEGIELPNHEKLECSKKRKPTNTWKYIYFFFQNFIQKLATLVKGDPTAPFLIVLHQVFGMTRPGIEPRSPGPLANTLTIMPIKYGGKMIKVNIIQWSNYM